MDSGDEMWLDSQSSKLDLTPYQFEQMIDRLEKITVCSLDDAKALVRRNEVNQDVFDYWVNKRLKTVNILFLSLLLPTTKFINFPLILLPYRNIHSYFLSKQRIEVIQHRTIHILRLEEGQKRCKQGKIGRMMKHHMRKC